MSVTFTAADRVGGIGGYIGGISTLLQMMGGWPQAAGLQAAPEYVTKEAFDRAELEKLYNRINAG